MKELRENSYRVQQDNSSNRAVVAPSNTLVIPPAPSNLLKLLGQPPGNEVVVGLAGNPKRKGWGFLLGE